MSKKIALALAVLVAVRIAFIAYTHHTFEDAFITFRFAQNIANGYGFVHNIGEPIYGTTTPLMTILLAIWVKIFPGTIVVGAWTIDVLASLLMGIFLWKTLEDFVFPDVHIVMVLLALTLSSFLILYETNGMELSLELCFMSISFYAMNTKHDLLCGISLGLLLWTRIDGIVWVVFLLGAQWLEREELPGKTVLIAVTVYLPWLVFAFFYFGTIIPQTIISKAILYDAGQHDFVQGINVIYGNIGLPMLLLVIAGVMSQFHRPRAFMLFAIYGLFEAMRLALLGQTFEARYFVPLMWCATILTGYALVATYDFFPRLPALATILIFVLSSLKPIVDTAQYRKLYQDDIYASLELVGHWLHDNTPPNSTVFLEPLGYAGFYADRRIFDEIGLITPSIPIVRKDNRNAWYARAVYNADYTVTHCDPPIEETYGFYEHYTLATTIDPLNYLPARANPGGFSGKSCWEIWRHR